MLIICCHGNWLSIRYVSFIWETQSFRRPSSWNRTCVFSNVLGQTLSVVDCCEPKVLRDTLPVLLKESASQSDLYLWALYCKTFTDLSSISAPVDPTCRCVELLSKQVLVLSSNPLWGLRDCLFSEVFTCVCVEFLNESQTQKQLWDSITHKSQLLQRDIFMSDSTLKSDQPQNPDVRVKSCCFIIIICCVGIPQI